MSDYLKSILNAFHDLLFVFSKDGIIEDYLTPNHQDELILPGEDFLGKNYQDVLPPQVSENLQQAFKQLEQGEEQVKFDYKLELKGEKHWFEAVISKMAYENESGYLGAVRNITRRKNYELLLRGVLNTSPGGIMVFRTVRDSGETIVDFEITHINKTVEELIGITEEELIGQRLTVAIPRELKDTMFERFKTVVETEKPVEFEYQHEPEPGDVTWYFAKLAKYKDGVISSFLNITKQKKNEEELARANEELKELNRQKDKLFSVISHDLRNSISGTLGIYDLILEDYEALPKEELVEYLTVLSERAKNTNELLQDLLQWSKNQFQEVTLDFQKLNLAEVTTAVFSRVRSNAEGKGIELKNQVPNSVFVQADLNLLSTILRNLITNGIKFSHPGGEVAVCAESKNNEVEISITDKGVGIEKEALDKILDKKRNYTTQGTSGEKGSGLGLDLCIDFVEKHGGELRVESEPGEGSSFTFTLPEAGSF